MAQLVASMCGVVLGGVVNVVGSNIARGKIFTASIGSYIYTHYHNSNLIWRTVSRRVDEVIPSDHPRRVALRVIQWYGLIHET